MGRKKKEGHQQRNDIWLAVFLLAFAALLGVWYYFWHQAPALRAKVSIDGELVEVLDLSEDQEVTIKGTGGGTNHLVVENGVIWCDKASCPDKVCVRQGKQSLDGGQIVCLPNRMFVQVTGDE